MRLLIFFFIFQSSLFANELLKDLALNYEIYQERCEKTLEPNFFRTKRAKNLAISNFLAQAQHFALKNVIRYVADAAKNLALPRPQYESTMSSIIQNQCSQNMSLISRNSLKEIAIERFDETRKEAKYSQSDYIEGLTLLSDFCSWHGFNHKNAMISYYLEDALFSQLVIENYVSSQNPVYCNEKKCRLMDRATFNLNYERSTNKVTFRDELDALYCFEIKNGKYQVDSSPDNYTKKRLKENKENLKKTKFYLYSSLFNRPAPLSFNNWSKNTSYFFSHVLSSEIESSKDVLELLIHKVELEEDLNLRAKVKTKTSNLNELSLKFDIAGDEFDRLVFNTDKLTWSFQLSIAEKELGYILNRIDRVYSTSFNNRDNNFDLLTKEVSARVVNPFYQKKLSKVPSLKLIPEISYQIAKGLIENLKEYKGQSNYRDGSSEKISIPVHFSFGWQALRRLSQMRKLDIK